MNKPFYYGDWIKEPGIAICSCNDGIRPSKITTTQRYAHPVPQRKLEAINILVHIHKILKAPNRSFLVLDSHICF